ncbi:hypothetical protein [uncultured Roseobacter sp.]|uniref:tetratricopeptide repeat protein n=1 Tax=uncultured Roseobacter sp. TaxID=114847 RepID=UPI00260C1B4B|nr:hypothetical protein [uncultured Roseobacter sp.]
MNSRQNIFVALCFASATASQAEPISVLAGEHEDFTRLVMELPEETSWQLDGESGAYTISVTGHDDGFDTSRTFSIIPRDRLGSVTSDTSKLSLTLNCDCPVTAFFEQGSYLIIDVKDGPPLPEETGSADPEQSEPIVERPQFESAFGFGDLLWSRPGAGQSPTEAIAIPEVANPAQEQTADESAAVRQQTQSALSLRIGEAIANGILEGSGDPLMSGNQEPDPPNSDLIFDSSARKPKTDDTTGNLRVSSSGDIPDQGLRAVKNLLEQNCLRPDRLDVASWGTDEPAPAQISFARERLFGDTGMLDDEAALALARLYIFLGFGAEARQTLTMSDKSEQYPELFDLSGIVDQSDFRNLRIAHLFGACEAPVALWAVFAGGTLPSENTSDTGSLVEAFFKLPPHLRAHLGPVFGKILVDADEIDTASIVLRNTEQVTGQDDTSGSIPRSIILQSQGRIDEAEKALRAAVDESNDESPAAVVALVNSILSSDKPVPADLMSTLEAYAFELRQTEASEDVEIALAHAKAQAGKFESAFEIINSLNASDRQMLTIRSSVFSNLAERASDFEFLQYFLSEFDSTPSFVAPGAARLLADRLVELGFPELSLSALEVVEGDFNTEQHRSLSAKIELKTGNPEAAIQLLATPRDSVEMQILAQAQFEAGRLSEARETFLELENRTSAAEAAWLAKNWSDLIESDTPVFGPVREASRLVADGTEPSDSIIGQAENVLYTTEETRTAIRNLLEGTALTAEN